MIDVDFYATVSEDARQFALAMRFASEARVVALYGPSGAGKSLTLRTIAGLLTPLRGHVRINGRTLFDAAHGIDVPPERRGIGCLFQHYALFPHLSVRENVAFGLTSWYRRRLSNDARKRVEDLLERFGLESLARSRTDGLSGGQRQRVALARALACRPDLLLLDEPFSALDPSLRSDLRRYLDEVLREWRIPAMMITHDVDDVTALADVAFVIEQGRAIREVDVRHGVATTLACVRRETPHEQRVRELLHVCATD
ncbi:ATP-binding cassette domain-containing protein [Trinickia caryophylli]|uniref:Molybdate transport system ATP-binding protein n=1 Tax=Trinickia caryophylli TaxID=28094 RepID=A0A1X7EF32_TRICW|nr:ATP-binding cassette domain-containing protein [Trinickia caryophylli]PMS11141.1 ABC transporter ATP-binding protein [Trinickia caryophylli]TRX14600.1 ATP-binding cassette domain-containing protein [Trinickia caryophylli]WQE14442.1 ATP-binding cassette domain-containing protein [Trinickia caryophylli]SMF32421.1 molybdate transport system ATP-binding protein [Trinickia caryophylli]GLU32155.1 ABC transporter ATP-binding protein [Trinickia caryophylli]